MGVPPLRTTARRTLKARKKGISIKEHARRIKMSPAGVRKGIKTGRIPINPEGGIDYERAKAHHQANTDPSFQRGQVIPPDLLVSKRIYEEYRAKTAQLEYEILSGTMIDLEVVKRQGRETGRIVREQLMGIPARVTPMLMGKLGLSDPKHQHIIMETLTREVHQALSALQEEASFLSRLSHATTPRP